MTFDVHIYATVRVKVASVEATSPEEAVAIAESQVDLHELFQRVSTNRQVTQVEYAEDITGYLVDECADQPAVYGMWFDSNDIQEESRCVSGQLTRVEG